MKKMSYKGSMYRSYLLKNDFYAKKNCQTDEKVFLKHDEIIGGIYAVIENGVGVERKGIRISANGETQFFNNFDKLDSFLSGLHRNNSQGDFMKMFKRRDISRKLRMLDI